MKGTYGTTLGGVQLLLPYVELSLCRHRYITRSAYKALIVVLNLLYTL